MKKLFMFPLMFLTVIAFSQNWTPEEKLVLERVQTAWSAWQDAENNKDLSIWLNAADPADDWQCWWTSDGGIRELEDTKRNFEFKNKDVSRFQWLEVDPISIKVLDDVAFIWFYASYSIEFNDGITSTTKQKRFEVYRKIDEKWRWSAGMVHVIEQILTKQIWDKSKNKTI